MNISLCPPLEQLCCVIWPFLESLKPSLQNYQHLNMSVATNATLNLQCYIIFFCLLTLRGRKGGNNANEKVASLSPQSDSVIYPYSWAQNLKEVYNMISCTPKTLGCEMILISHLNLLRAKFHVLVLVHSLSWWETGHISNHPFNEGHSNVRCRFIPNFYFLIKFGEW